MEKSGEGFNLPEWYRIEQESKKAIERLHGIKELAFYSENPDPFIRRLAIIRAGELGGKEAFSMLNDVMEDPLENEQNRMLAGACLCSISNSLGLGCFIQSRFMQAHQVDAVDSGKVLLPVIDSQPAIRYEFSKSLIESQLQMDQSIIKINMDDREFDFPFELKSWLNHLAGNFKTNLIGLLKKSVLLARTFLVDGCRKFFISLPKSVANKIKLYLVARRDRINAKKQPADIKEVVKQIYDAEATVSKEPDLTISSPAPVEFIAKKNYRRPESPVRYSRPKTYRLSVLTRCRIFIRQFFFVLFWPLRFIYRHKLVVLASMLAIYLPISLTVAGKAFLFRMNPRLYEANERFMQSVGQYAVKAFQGTLFSQTSESIDSPSDKIPAAPPKAALRYIVTAPKGLYLRDKPAEDGEKIELMKLSTTVEYLDEKTENKGVTWYKIKLNDGTSGWTNSEWLKEENDG